MKAPGRASIRPHSELIQEAIRPTPWSRPGIRLFT